MIRPLRDYLVVRYTGGRLAMSGSLYLPDTDKLANKTSGRCEVVWAGPKVETAKPGTTVILCAYGEHLAGEELIHHGEKLIMIRERDVLVET